MNNVLATIIHDFERAVAGVTTDRERGEALHTLFVALCDTGPQCSLALSDDSVRMARDTRLETESASHRFAASPLNLSAGWACPDAQAALLATLWHALAVAEENELLPEMAQCHLALSTAYKAQHDFARALHHHEQLRHVEQALMHQQTSVNIQRLHTLDEIELLQRQATIYRIRNIDLEYEIAERERAEAALQHANTLLQARIDELSVLSATTQIALDQTDLSSILDALTQQVTQTLDASGTMVALLNTDKTTLTFVADHDRDPAARDFTGLVISLTDMPQITSVLDSQQPVVLTQPIIDDLITMFDPAPRLGRYHCLLFIPLVVRRETIGGFIITSDQDGYTFSDNKIRMAQTLAGQVAGVIERAQLLDEALRARAAAEAANQSKSQFLATMSHELRLPLTGILGYTQLLALEGSLTEPQRELLGLIEQSSKHLMSLITDLLDLTRIESGNVALDVQPFIFDLFLSDVSVMAGMWAQQKGLVLQTNIDDAWLSREPSYRLYADARRLRQILINLLGNAVKFTQHGQVTLTVSVVPSGQLQQQQARIRFQIDDAGIGIPPEELNLIFMPFHQVGDADQRAAGTGLGLAICVELLRLMGSSLHVASTPGAGSSFWFELVLPVESGDVTP